MILRNQFKEIDQKKLVMVLQESKKQRAQAKEVSTIYTVESECNKPAVSQRYALKRIQK